VETVAVVDLPAYFDLSSASGPQVSDNLAVLGAEDAGINELLGEWFSSNLCIGRCLMQQEKPSPKRRRSGGNRKSAASGFRCAAPSNCVKGSPWGEMKVIQVPT
jgi:hypothetical protein